MSKRSYHLSLTILILLVASLVTVNDAEAYVDPGASSFLIQGLIGGVAAAIVLLRQYAGRVTSWLRGRKAGDRVDV